MTRARTTTWVLAAALLGFGACGGPAQSNGFGPSGGGSGSGSGGSGGGDDAGDDVGSFGPGDDGATPGCNTTISGTVYDPAGKNPLYDIAVYVPSAPLSPIPTGATCDSCTSLYSGNPVAAALTDASGKFVMNKAPTGKNVPLVLQIGKWRKQVYVPTVTACQDNPMP
ncbi:MAG TPA: carboxypeptidase regulatory-like domain-containing protein, partial [Polyangiaceae bacterium]